MGGFDAASAGRTDANGGIDTFGLLHIPTEAATTVVQPTAAATFVESGTLAGDGESITVDTTGMAGVMVELGGTFAGDSGLYFERSFDGGTTWSPARAADKVSTNGAISSFAPTSGTTYIFALPSGGANRVRVLKGGTLDSGAINVQVAATSADAGLVDVRLTSVVGTLPVLIDDTVGVSIVSSPASLATTASATLAAVDDAASFGLLVEDVVIQTVDNSFVGTLVCEVSVDGANWTQVPNSLLFDVAAGATGALDPSGVWCLRLGSAINNVRVRCSAYTSGDVAVSLLAARR